MRLVEWVDKGRKKYSYVKDGDPDEMARYGLPVSIPDLDSIDWDAVKFEMRDILEGQGLFTWKDVERNNSGFASAISVIKRHLIRLYREGA